MPSRAIFSRTRRRPPRVNQEDLQGNVLCGYGNEYRYGLYTFVHVHDAAVARCWLGELTITNATRWRKGRDETLNVALTFDGLEAAGVSNAALRSFPEEFRDGMEARAELLGDTGHNDPENWEPGLRAGESHLLVTVTAKRADVLAQCQRLLNERVGRSGGGLEVVHEVPAALLDNEGNEQFGREHFGFVDGLAQPSIEGEGTIPGEGIGPYKRPGKGVPESSGEWRPLKPGEFVLGYVDEDGIKPRAPREPFDRDCSFMVVRKLHQDVAAFTTCLRRQAQDERDEEFLAAKIVGRWKDGTPLVMSPKEPVVADMEKRARAEIINDFRYDDEDDHDRDGLRCPLGAHIRRANPRDAFGGEDRRTRRHRIIRRGMPYGPPADPGSPDGEDRGLMFVCYQASIERQFEIVQAWLTGGDAFGLGDEKDFLLSGEEPGGHMTIQGDRTTYLPPGPHFVTLKGGDYFFTPSIPALREIAAGRA